MKKVLAAIAAGGDMDLATAVRLLAKALLLLAGGAELADADGDEVPKGAETPKKKK